MKLQKKLLLFFLIVILSCQSVVFAAPAEEASIKLMITDESGDNIVESFTVQFYRADTAELVSSVEMLKSAGWQATFSLPAEYPYVVTIQGLPEGYRVFQTLDSMRSESVTQQSFRVSETDSEVYWSIVNDNGASEGTQAGGSGSTVDTEDSVAADSDTAVKSEAEEVYREFLDAVSFIETDESWNDSGISTLTLYEETSINGRTYSEYYASYVAGGTKEGFFALSPYEKFLWAETYLRFAGAVNSGWGYSHFFESESTFAYTITDMVVFAGDNSDIVKEAYLKLAAWQYDYICETGVPYNFINNRSYLEELNAKAHWDETSSAAEEETTEAGVVTPEEPVSGEELQETQPETEEEKGIWDDTLSALADNAFTLLLLIILGIAAFIVTRIRKNKMMSGDH